MKKEILILIGIIVLVLGLGLVMAVQDIESTTATVNVNQFLSVTLTSGYPVTFGDLNPGTNNSKPTNDPLNITIGSETNVVSIYVKTKADTANFTGLAADLAVSNLEWDTTTDGFPGTDYTITPATVCSGLGANGNCKIYHELDIPGAQTAGSYTVGITITATTIA